MRWASPPCARLRKLSRNLLTTADLSLYTKLTALTSSPQGLLVLTDPRDEARDLDETWVGTWEETFGPAQPIDEAEKQSVSLLHDLNRLPESDSEKIHFLVGRDTAEQAKAVVALTANFLQDKDCERIGILFPRDRQSTRLNSSHL